MVISMAEAVIYGKIKTHMTVSGNMGKCVAKASKPSQMADSAAALSREAWSMALA